MIPVLAISTVSRLADLPIGRFADLLVG